MAANKKQLFYNLILVCIVVIIGVMTVFGSDTLQSLALEQKTRCDLEEHKHTEDCYMGDVLLCEKKAHIHSSNCYLVCWKITISTGFCR